MIDRLIMNGAKVVAEKYAERFAKGIADFVRPSVFDGYTVNYSYPVSEPCPDCGHVTYHTDDPEIAFCPCCKRLLYIIE